MIDVIKKSALSALFTLVIAQTAQAGFEFGFSSGFPYVGNIHLGYAPQLGTSGFGVRGNVHFAPIIGINFAVDGYYYLPLEKSESGFYFGLGAGIIPSFAHQECHVGDKLCSNSPIWPEIHALTGFNWQFNKNASLFIELRELLFFTSNGVTSVGWPFANIGASFRL